MTYKHTNKGLHHISLYSSPALANLVRLKQQRKARRQSLEALFKITLLTLTITVLALLHVLGAVKDAPLSLPRATAEKTDFVTIPIDLPSVAKNK
jgi:hypothetical protein